MSRQPLVRLLVVGGIASLAVAAGQAQTTGLALLPMAPADIQTLVRQAIEDRVAARDIPDLDLRRHDSPTLILRQEMTRAKMRLGPDAVPQVNGYTFVVRTTAERQADADRTGRGSDMFIIVDSAGIAGSSAFVDLGTDLVVPTSPKVDRQCCCIGNGRFNGVGTRWVFERWVSMVCP